MPLIQVTIIQGRSKEKKENFCKQVTEIATKNLDVKPSQVRIVINEIPADSWFVGGISKAESEKDNQ